MDRDDTAMRFIVFARLPVAGSVKTRLIDADGLTAGGAAAAAVAMLRCVVERLCGRGPVALAVTPDRAGPRLLELIDRPDVTVIDQGPGDLGARLDRVWRTVAPGDPVACFGIDSPDVPDAALDAIRPALERCDAAVGPTRDGGYWTIAGRRPVPGLLASIDWGSDRVYDQTCQRAADAGLSLAALPAWHDVDTPADLDALRRRIERSAPGPVATLRRELQLIGENETP